MVNLEKLLENSSRTFALNIPYLPEPTRRQVTIAYLLFRIADTFEDSTLWQGEKRIGALLDWASLMESPDPARAASLTQDWLSDPPVQHSGYLDLLTASDQVLQAYAELEPHARRCVGEHTVRTCHGMADVVGRMKGGTAIQLRDLGDLRDYCYIVAGIVGEMLTELFLLHRDRLSSVAGYLRDRARLFGEGLQLTNIVKDAAADRVNGQVYLPPSVPLSEVFGMARRSLDAAREYTLALQEAGAERGIIAFNAIPIQLAAATLDSVERRGPGAKISRIVVGGIIGRLNAALDRELPLFHDMPTEARSSGAHPVKS
jgi:farnesyl-diphosphate farnesyltransferase